MKIDDLVHYVRLETPGVMDVIINQAIAATAMDFCERTRVWTEIQDPVALVDNVNQYDMDGPADARVLTIANVWAANRELKATTMAALVYVLPNWQTAKASQPQYYSVARDLKVITVYPIPLEAQSTLLTFRAQYAPRRTATTLPDFLGDNYHDALVAGAKARLMVQVHVPWSSPATGMFYQQVYEQAVAKAQADQLHEQTPTRLRVRPVRFI